MLLMLLVGFLTYKVTLLIHGLTHKDTSSINKEGTVVPQDGTADNVCKNLIYITDDEDNIVGVVLEILNTYTNNLDYITIPRNTQFALSTDLYQKLYAKNNQIPQIISLDKIGTYFDKLDQYAYGKFIVNELIGTELSCYTIIDKETADSVFKKEQRTTRLQTGETYESSVYTIKDSIINSIASEESYSMKEYLAHFYEVANSNLSLQDKQSYAGTYRNVNAEYIYYYTLPGEDHEDCYQADVSLTKSLIEQIINNEAYTKNQEEAQQVEAISSVGKTISLLNGSKITGLAAEYSNKLRNEGYPVSEVGNYTGEVLQNTKIVVSEQGMGQDLLPLFKDAQIEVGTLPLGYDIQIILGVSEKY